jgi:hypothetical protein
MPSTRKERLAALVPPSAAWSQSKSWTAPHVLRDQSNKRLNRARSKLCPASFAWPQNFDLAKHQAELSADQLDKEKKQLQQRIASAQAKSVRDKDLAARGFPPPSAPSIDAPFRGREFTNTPLLSPVLSLPTVFNPTFPSGKGHLHPAPWPCKEEMDHEGNARIAKVRQYQRCLPPPRVPGNETVKWSEKMVIKQFALDDMNQAFAMWGGDWGKEEDDKWQEGKVDLMEVPVEMLGRELWEAIDE